MLKKIAIAVIVILAVIFGMAMMQPDTFTVTRSTTIKAPPEKIIAAGERLPQLAKLVAMGKPRPEHAAHLQRPGQRHRRGLHVERQ